tara:strand:+ start:181 stop:396 length:216 start_codon:yes stop_codon:yes gene_type:complete
VKEEEMTKAVENLVVTGLPELYFVRRAVLAILNPAIDVPTSDSEVSIFEGYGVGSVSGRALHFWMIKAVYP